MSIPVVKIDNLYTRVFGLSEKIAEQIKDEISYEIPNVDYVLQYLEEQDRLFGWDGRIRFLKKRSRNKKVFYEIPAGLTYKLCQSIKDKTGVYPKVYRVTKPPKKTLDLKWNEDFKLRNYQQDLIDTLKRKTRGILCACTGSGKTVMVARIIHDLGVAPFIFYVLTKDLMYQSKLVLEKTMPGLEVGIIGDGICEIKDINVMTVQTAIRVFSKTEKDFKKEMEENKKISEMDESEVREWKKEKLTHVDSRKKEIKNLVKDCVGIYGDEIHHFACDTCEHMMMQSPKAYYRFGGSATPERGDNAYLTIEGLFGRQTAVVTASDLIKKDFLLKPKIRFIRLQGKRQKASNYSADRNIHIVNNPERNACIVNLANKLLEQNISTLILVQIIEHGKQLQKLIPGSVFVHGSTKKEKRAEALKKLESGELKMMIASVIADEGLDIPTLSALIMAGGGKSPTKAKQRVGRVIRKGSPHALVWDFMDVGKWTKKHSKDRIKILTEEEEFDVNTISADEILMKEIF